MSRRRIAVIVVTCVVLIVLLGWQMLLDRRVGACHEAGGVWDGPSGQCRSPPAPTILERGIERS